MSQSVPLDGGYWHGKCAVDAVGIEGLVALHPDDTAHVTIADVGVEGMRRLLAPDQTSV
jgi:hypothetical protein